MILLRDASGGWKEPTEFGYESENALQEILFNHPTLVPGVNSESVACKEFQSGVGPADVLIVDTEGSLTLVECKLTSNAQIRREIIGQVLDYASRLWQMTINDFEDAWRRASGYQSPFELLDDSDGRIRAGVSENLSVGRFNLVLAVDGLNDDLRRIVEFLNEITKPSTGIVVVEFTRVRDGDTEILIPREYGTELVEAKNAAVIGGRPAWTVEQFTRWIHDHDPQSTGVYEALISALTDSGFVVGGGKARTPSLYAQITIPGMGRKYPIAMYTDAQRGGLLEIRFSDFNSSPSAVDRFAEAVSSVPGVPLSLEEIRDAGYRRRPSIPFREFSPQNVIQLAQAIGSMA